MNEKRYQLVVDNLSQWRPTKTNKVFTVSNVMDIIDEIATMDPITKFEIAYGFFERLKKENKIPKGMSTNEFTKLGQDVSAE